jgi:hypothetical protein
MQVKHGVVTGVLDANGELSDEAARHIHDVIQTKTAILQYIEPIAQVLAEAGRASAKAMGDDADYAIDRWLEVIRERAHAILREASREEQEAARRRIEARRDARRASGSATAYRRGETECP